MSYIVEPAEMKRYEDLENDDGTVVRYRRHDNGGGLIGAGADAAEDAYVASTAWVDPRARVDAGAHLGDHVWLESGAVVETGARLGSHVHVEPGAVVGAGARLGTRVTVGAGARVEPGVVVPSDQTIPAGTVLRRSAARSVAA